MAGTTCPGQIEPGCLNSSRLRWSRDRRTRAPYSSTDAMRTIVTPKPTA